MPRPSCVSHGGLRLCRVLAALATVISLIGCREAARVTYTRDVAPILFTRCGACHSPGGSGPFSLLDYQSARERARLIVDATQKRFMPPWLPEPGYGEFKEDRRLTSQEIETIKRWFDDGMTAGRDADLPALPATQGGWRLGQPDLIIRMPRPYTLPAGGTDIWRNFVIPVPIEETRYVKAIEIHPGSARFVHHALMGIDALRTSRRRDAQDQEVGFAGMDMGDAEMPDGTVLGWTPGLLPNSGVEGASWRLNPGTDAVLQLHMLPSGKPETIDASVGFYFANDSELRLTTYVLQLDADDQIDIPPGAREFAVSDAIELPVDVEVLSVYPHAHYLGKRVEAHATLPDGTSTWLLRIDRWDFKWQDIYRYKRPVRLPRGSVVTMRWTYDNSSENRRQSTHPPRRVVAGDRSSDEMAHLLVQMRLSRPEDLPRLKEAHYGHLVDKDPQSARFLFGLAGALKDEGRLVEAAARYQAAIERDPAHVAARINLGAVLTGLGKEADALAQFRAAVRLDPDAPGAHYNLGIALSSYGRLEEAIHHYGEALKWQPYFGEAHNNLGQLLVAAGRLDEAVVHLREAVRLLPRSADVHNNLGVALEQQRKPLEAVEHFRAALAIDSGHADATRNLAAASQRQ